MLEPSILLNHALKWYLNMVNMLDFATDGDYYSFPATTKKESSNNGNKTSKREEELKIVEVIENKTSSLTKSMTQISITYYHLS